MIDMDMKDIDEDELMQIEGGNDFYGPCGCIPFPFPDQCPMPPPDQIWT